MGKTTDIPCSKQSAYAFIKSLLGIPAGAMVNKNFFNLFFSEKDGLYKPKKSKEEIKNIFALHDLKELNNAYYFNQRRGNVQTAQNIKDAIMERASEAMRAA